MEDLSLKLTKGEISAIRDAAASENTTVENLILQALSKFYLRFGNACDDCLNSKPCGIRGRRRCNCSYYQKPLTLGMHDGAKPFIPY